MRDNRDLKFFDTFSILYGVTETFFFILLFKEALNEENKIRV